MKCVWKEDLTACISECRCCLCESNQNKSLNLHQEMTLSLSLYFCFFAHTHTQTTHTHTHTHTHTLPFGPVGLSVCRQPSQSTLLKSWLTSPLSPKHVAEPGLYFFFFKFKGTEWTSHKVSTLSFPELPFSGKSFSLCSIITLFMCKLPGLLRLK